MIKPGKHYYRWQKFRKQWLRDHPAPYDCAYCGCYLDETTVTLDHKIPRSRRPDLRYEESNIVPACWKCNGEKGSKVYGEVASE